MFGVYLFLRGWNRYTDLFMCTFLKSALLTWGSLMLKCLVPGKCLGFSIDKLHYLNHHLRHIKCLLVMTLWLSVTYVLNSSIKTRHLVVGNLVKHFNTILPVLKKIYQHTDLTRPFQEGFYTYFISKLLHRIHLTIAASSTKSDRCEKSKVCWSDAHEMYLKQSPLFICCSLSGLALRAEADGGKKCSVQALVHT